MGHELTDAQSFYLARGKRIVDTLGATAILVSGLPVYVACAVAIRIIDGSPVFFHHERIGLYGRPFRVHKFRTMRTDAGQYPSDDMVTKTGKLLRRWSLDELPQVANILKGEMSFIGPRPAIPDQVARYNERQRGRLTALPGLTGLAQVRYRNSATWSVRIEADLEYIQNRSFIGDFRIALQTLKVALRGTYLHTGQTRDQVDDLGGSD